MPTRTAHATWQDGLRSGSGTFRGEGGAIGGAYSFGSRFENGSGSNPEELLAAAEAACFSMALSAALEKNGTPGERVETDAACTIEREGEGFRITRIALEVRASVRGIDDATFQRLANETKDGCPVSRALRGNLEITLRARLNGGGT